MKCQLRILFLLHFFVFKQTVSHLTVETIVEQVLRTSTNPLSKISWTSTIRCSVTRIDQTKKTFSTVPRMLRTWTQMGELDLEEVGC